MHGKLGFIEYEQVFKVI